MHRRIVLVTALLALVFHAGVVAVKTYTHPSHSVLAVFRVGALWPEVPAFVFDEGYPLEHDGYGTDGQQYLFVAHDPLALGKEMPRAVDHARYRYGRILLPALAWTTCGGSSPCIPRAIIAYNLAFAAGIGALLAWLVKQRDAHWGWGVLLACTGALACSTDIGNVELCAQFFALAGVVLAAKDRIFPAVVAFALATLARESYALVPIAYALAAALDKRWRTTVEYAAACAPAALWMLYLRARLPADPMGAASNFSYPFGGIAFQVIDFLKHPHIDGHTTNAVIGGALLAMMARHAAAIRADRSGLALSGALLTALGLVAAQQVWLRAGGFARALDFAYPAIVLPALARRDRVTAYLSLATLLQVVNIVGDHLVVGPAL